MPVTQSEIISAIFSIKNLKEITLGDEFEGAKKTNNIGLGTLYKAKHIDEER